MNNILLIIPSHAHSAYRIAADAFLKLAAAAEDVTVTEMADLDAVQNGIPDTYENIVLLGSDAVNHYAMELYFQKVIDDFGFRYCTDEYCIRTFRHEGKNVLLLAGARPRAAIYAVYRYFELFCGCRYFWDGDRIPKSTLPFENIDVHESPRFAYRGLRYFAHRSLHRFQAEHWSLEDWKQEIDWMLKKRLNIFMLRIGMDDIFQKAFPDMVPYPNRDEKLPEARNGYDDRTLFWSLEYRGELRKKLLAYAFACDLMHPEDCGTMTHWYSRTPLAYLEKAKPTLLSQASSGYAEQTGLVWDIKDDTNLENYFKLTETHVREYGKPEIFHTIGLAERSYSSDRNENLRLKLYVYHRIASYLKEKYPGAPLLIASWDLWMFYTPEEVQKLLSQLDPNQAILMDYTSDTPRQSNFTTWGCVGKFPWIFGIFSGYEPNSDIRGLYDLTNERLKIAKEDPMCKGLILWPELSHGDTFVTEYLARNAWETDTLTIPEAVEKYCMDRYSSYLQERMLTLWQKLMPLVQTRAWSVDKTNCQNSNDIFPLIRHRAQFTENAVGKADQMPDLLKKLAADAAFILRELAALWEQSASDTMLRRDICDISRTVLGRYVDAGILYSEILYLHRAEAGNTDRLDTALAETVRLNECLCGVLGAHEDYSMFHTLERMRSVAQTNPNFEETLKNNACNGYCRGYIYENARWLYLPEMQILFDAVKDAAHADKDIDWNVVDQQMKENLNRYYAVSLEEMDKQEKTELPELLQNAAKIIESFLQ